MSYMRDARGSRLDSFDALRDLPPVVAYYDFSKLTSADGAPIIRAPDLSGLGHDLVQATAAYQPTKQTDATDSKPVARFTGTQLLACTTFGSAYPLGATVPTPVTLAVLVKASATQGTSFPHVFGGTAAGGSCKLQVDASASLTAMANGGTTNTGVFGPQVLDNTWHSIIITLDLAAASVYVDGYLTSAANATIGTDGLKSLALGAVTSTTGRFSGDVRLAMAIAGRLRTDQVQNLAAWLATKAPVPTPGLSAAGSAWEQTTDANGTAVRIFAPTQPSTPKTLVLWSHPASQTEQIAPGYWAYSLAHAAMANGWYFAASNQHGDPWGNSQGLTDIQALDTLMATRDTFTKKILAGASMGGLTTALLLANGSISNAVGGYFIDAVLSLQGQYGNSSYTSQIATAYGLTSGTLSAASTAGATSISSSVSFPSGTQLLIDPSGTNPETVTTNGAPTGAGPYTIPVPALAYAHASGAVVSDFPAKTSGHDPLLKPASAYATRLRFTASTSDTNVVKTANTDPFRTLVAATATESGLTTHAAGHLVGAAANPADFVAFVKRCIGP